MTCGVFGETAEALESAGHPGSAHCDAYYCALHLLPRPGPPVLPQPPPADLPLPRTRIPSTGCEGKKELRSRLSAS